MKKIALIGALGLLYAGFAAPAQAQTMSTGYVSWGLGVYDIFPEGGERGGEFRVEYRPDKKVFFENLKPWIGAGITEHASFWAGGGLLYDLQVSDHFFLVPGFGVVYGHQRGDNEDLEYPILIRSQLEAAYQFESMDRVSLSFSNFSNWGIEDENPGVEILGLYWHMPLKRH